MCHIETAGRPGRSQPSDQSPPCLAFPLQAPVTAEHRTINPMLLTTRLLTFRVTGVASYNGQTQAQGCLT